MTLVLIGKDLLLEAKRRTNGFQVYIYIYLNPPFECQISAPMSVFGGQGAQISDPNGGVRYIYNISIYNAHILMETK